MNWKGFYAVCFWILCFEFLRPDAAALDLATERGKVFCGYQGWFRAEGDGTGLGWVHYGPGKKMGPGNCTFDLWPDLSEFGPSERFASPFRFRDGRVAELFSSVHPDTVRRHFRWMREYGIDGAFVQRFGTVLSAAPLRPSADRVLELALSAAESEGRMLGLMYDLTNLNEAQFPVVLQDWRTLMAGGLAERACFPRYNGRPLVAVFGLGFARQPASAAAWRTLLKGFQDTHCAVLVGVPAFWRTATRDADPDPAFLEMAGEADVLMPWTVGRMRDARSTETVAREVWGPDIAWCRERRKGYLPTLFPGFSWHNLSKTRGVDAALDAIPRQGGRFLWKQAVESKRAGADHVYIAMFDEVDEGTAIFKCGGERPIGGSPFVDLSDEPSDHYLWLSGQTGRLLRGEIDAGELPPGRPSAR
ncbi:MAG: hypothetical protein RLZZ253_3379, partial [Verrucomicrobiota bacterium]